MKILQFSGGMDSLACLHLLKDLPGLRVLTTSTGGAYPEREQELARVAAAYPQLKFINVFGDRQLERFGAPVDVVPVAYTLVGHLTQGTPLRYQSYMECCSRGLWKPMAEACVQIGATDIYRGQRATDKRKAPIKDGHVEMGITYHFPIYNWSREQVESYVHENCYDLVPAYYNTEKTSRDCWDCTAYLDENMDRIRGLPKEQRVHVTKILEQWRRDVRDEVRW